jgi:glycerol-3-phosphate dehydrogenase
MRSLKRDIKAIGNKEYDLVIIGGGIFGACVAWDAALRGLSVAIVDKGDFSHATSANHFKMVHGGIRYLQNADLYRIRESSRERSALLRIAPHLVQPLPIVIPTYGHGTNGKEFLGMGMLIYDILTLDRNQSIQAERRIPRGRLISRQEVLRLFPGISEKGLTGGMVFFDGQMYNPPRLAISFLRSAANEGADAANYVKVTSFLRRKNRIFGVRAQDVLAGSQFEIRGRMVLNTAGPWAHRLLEAGLEIALKPKPTFSRDLAFVVKRKIHNMYALAVSTKVKVADSIVDMGGRRLFVVPWKDEYALIGVWHVVFKRPPEEISVTDGELHEFINEVNEAYPTLALSLNDILMVNTGLTLYGEEHMQGPKSMSFGKRSQLIDHSRDHHIEGLVTLIGVRATTARGMAKKAIDLISRKLGGKIPKCKTEVTPIYGGHIDSFDNFLSHAIANRPPVLTSGQMRALVHNYGSQFPEVLKYGKKDPTLIQSVADSTLLRVEVIHAVTEEMAQKLTDIVFRRTDLASGGYPGEDAIRCCAEIMATEMEWDQDRMKHEINELKNVFPRLSTGFGLGSKQ